MKKPQEKLRDDKGPSRDLAVSQEKVLLGSFSAEKEGRTRVRYAVALGREDHVSMRPLFLKWLSFVPPWRRQGLKDEMSEHSKLTLLLFRVLHQAGRGRSHARPFRAPPRPLHPALFASGFSSSPSPSSSEEASCAQPVGVEGHGHGQRDGGEGLGSEENEIRPGKDTRIELLPRIILVGRPNVGKSALFNRLTRRREALVYDTPDAHVTRDVREGVARLGDLRFRIFDTAGLETEADPASVLVRTAGLTSSVLRNSHIALFLLDGRSGLHPLDYEVGKWLRKEAPEVPVVVALNKAENIQTEASGMVIASWAEAHGLGLGDPVAISAETGMGLTDLYEILEPLLVKAATQTSASAIDMEKESGELHEDGHMLPLQLAIAGRPNVGKSTLLNALLRQERVLTGPEPGLTRDSVRVEFEYEGNKVYLVDTAGWIERSNIKQGPSALSAMHTRRNVMRAHIVMLVLDAEHIANARKTMTHSESSLARWVTQEGRGLVVVINKMDLLKGKQHEELRNKVMKAIPEELRLIMPQVMGVPLIFASAKEKKGGASIMRKVWESYQKWNVRLPTARLNNWLQKVLCRHPRRGEGGYGAKIRYITQVKARPPTFVVFITGSGHVQETDLRFLASALREDFNLGGIPLRIIPRHKTKTMRKVEIASQRPKTTEETRECAQERSGA